MPEGFQTLVAAVRRQWWIVAGTVAVAVAVTMALSATREIPDPSYEGRAYIAVDGSTLSRYPRLPEVERVLDQASSEEFLDKAAEELGVSDGELESGFRAFSQTNPQSRIVVSFRSAEESRAAGIAGGLAVLVADEARRLSATEVEKQRRTIALTAAAVKDIEDLGVDTATTLDAWQRADVVDKLWSMRTRLDDARYALERIEDAYLLLEGVEVTELPVMQRRGGGVAAAALIGVVLGACIASVRELLRLRVDRAGAVGED